MTGDTFLPLNSTYVGPPYPSESHPYTDDVFRTFLRKRLTCVWSGVTFPDDDVDVVTDSLPKPLQGERYRQGPVATTVEVVDLDTRIKETGVSPKPLDVRGEGIRTGYDSESRGPQGVEGSLDDQVTRMVSVSPNIPCKTPLDPHTTEFPCKSSSRHRWCRRVRHTMDSRIKSTCPSRLYGHVRPKGQETGDLEGFSNNYHNDTQCSRLHKELSNRQSVDNVPTSVVSTKRQMGKALRDSRSPQVGTV